MALSLIHQLNMEGFGLLCDFESGIIRKMMHFVSALPDAGPYHEFNVFTDQILLESPSYSLSSEEGRLKAVPV